MQIVKANEILLELTAIKKKKLKERNGEVLYVSNMEVHAYGKINIVFSLIFASSLTVAQICS